MPKEATMYKYFLKYKFSYLLAMLSVVSIAQNIDASAYKSIGEFANVTKMCIDTFDSFLNKNDKRPYREFVETLRKIIETHPLTVRSELLQSDLDREANKIVQEYKKKIYLIKTILQKHLVEKNALKLASELKKIKIEEVFGKLKKALGNLQKKATAQNEMRLVNMINRFIKYIDKQKAAWNKRKPSEIYSAICKRMKPR